MKILAEITTAAVRGPHSTTYRADVREVEVAVLVRYRATRFPDLNRWHYMADIVDHPDLCPEAIRIGVDDRYRVRVSRKLNPRWRPPTSGWAGNVWREGGAS